MIAPAATEPECVKFSGDDKIFSTVVYKRSRFSITHELMYLITFTYASTGSAKNHHDCIYSYIYAHNNFSEQPFEI